MENSLFLGVPILKHIRVCKFIINHNQENDTILFEKVSNMDRVIFGLPTLFLMKGRQRCIGLFHIFSMLCNMLICCERKSPCFSILKQVFNCLTLLHSERPKLHAILAFLSAIGLIMSLWSFGPSECHRIKW